MDWILDSIGNKVITKEDFGVRLAKDGEKFLALDGSSHILNNESNVITCNNIP